MPTATVGIGPRHKLFLAAMVTTVASVAACAGVGDQTDPTTSRNVSTRTDLNVLVVVVDDAADISCARFDEFMPKTAALLRDGGTCFAQATASGPTCAPSRAALMTSQLGHNNGVRLQSDAPKVRVTDTIQATLTDAGYTTYGVGKYFNGLSAFDVEAGTIDSGFGSSDFWSSSKPYGYQLWDDETRRPYVPRDGVHATTRTGTFLRRFIASQQGAEAPFYAYAAFKAPHTDNSAPTLEARMPRATPPNRRRPVPTFRYRPEPDTRDKLPIFRGRLATQDYYRKLYTARTRALYDVDDEMGRTFAELRRTGTLDRTAIFFTSDQGYHLGENGWETKGDPYPATSDVPLLAWLPDRFRPGRTDTRQVSGIDIGPTIYELTGVRPGHRVDGRSLLAPGRHDGIYTEGFHDGRPLRLRAQGYYPGRIPTWSMYRTREHAYVEYYDVDGTVIAREFYRDPAMRRNLLAQTATTRRPSPTILAELRSRLRVGRTCSGPPEAASGNPCP